MNNLLKILDKKKEKLNSLRPLPSALIKNLNEWFKIELTYSSNALEGNTLTKSETALVVEKGLTIGGKSVREHLEAINLAHALDYIQDLATKTNRSEIQIKTILDLHQLILKKIDDTHAGIFRTIQVKIAGSDIELPIPIKVPELMGNFIDWLHTTQEHPVLISADAHLKLVMIHPFVDGNGRTARLLMNLLLMQTGYPPAIISMQDRTAYINAITEAELKHDFTNFRTLICKAVEKSLDIYLDAAEKSS